MCYKCCFKSYLTAPRLAYTPILSQAAITYNVLCFSAPKTTSLHNIHSSLWATVTYSLFQGLLKCPLNLEGKWRGWWSHRDISIYSSQEGTNISLSTTYIQQHDHQIEAKATALSRLSQEFLLQTILTGVTTDISLKWHFLVMPKVTQQPAQTITELTSHP